MGPLWSQSLFGFEAKNGDLIKFVKAKTNVLQQITSKYILSHTLSGVENESAQNSSKITVQYADKINKFTHEEEKILYEHGIVHQNCRIWQRVLINGQIYTSTTYRENKIIDYFVQLANKQIGTIKHYIQFGECTYALLEIFEICERSNHLLEVISTKTFTVVNAYNIVKKMIFFKIGARQIACSTPNMFEKS